MFVRTHSGSLDDMPDGMRRLMGPLTVDDMVRQAVKWCWITSPREVAQLEYVEEEIRRLTEQALRDFGENGEGFQMGEPPAFDE